MKKDNNKIKKIGAWIAIIILLLACLLYTSIAVDIGVAKYQLSQREEGKYVILDEPIQSEEYGIGFKTVSYTHLDVYKRQAQFGSQTSPLISAHP